MSHPRSARTTTGADHPRHPAERRDADRRDPDRRDPDRPDPDRRDGDRRDADCRDADCRDAHPEHADPEHADPEHPDPEHPDPEHRNAGHTGHADSEIPLDTPLELPDPADTEELGFRLARGLGPGDLVVLAGPLGAGKTVVVRGLARGLGVAGPITSPTFVIAREHRPLPGGAGVPLVHVDAYRLGTTGGDVAAELDDLDLDTDLADAVVAVEWGEGVAERLSARHLLVRLERRPDEVRVAIVHRAAPA